MRQTLLYIPHELLQGWLTLAWVVFGALFATRIVRRSGWGRELRQWAVMVVVIGAVIHFLLPRLEVSDYAAGRPPQLEPAGLPVRGYGLMMMIGIVAGTGLAVLRARQSVLNVDRLLSFCFCMVVCGLIGARVFFVVQKFELFQQATFGLTLAAMLDMTQGGLVVYGSLIGAMIGGGLYALRARMPLLETADVVAPGMLLGLAIGRIGCFFNGCCFGGPCDIQWLQVRFPAGAPPYVTQLESGELLGLTTTAVKLPVPTSSASPGIDWMTGYRVDAVAPGSIAHRYGVQPGEQILISFDDDLVMRAVHGRRLPIESTVLIQSDRGPTRAIPLRELPARSLSVHPTQLYSSLNALILTAVTWCLFTFRGRPGTVFGAFLVLKGVTRFLLEIIRADELGVGSTGLTISQWGSLIAIALGLALLGGVWLAKTGRTAVSASASAADTPAPQPKV